MKDFLDKVLKKETAFLIMMGQYILISNSNPQSAYAMGIIAKKHFLLKNYEDYVNVFLKKKIVKSPELEDAEHLINFISGKDLFYRSIYNLSAWELEVLWEYLNSVLNKR